MKYLLYCSVETLINCSSEKFEIIIDENTISNVKVDDNLWLIEIIKYNHQSYLDVTDDFFNDFIEPYTNDNSIFLISILHEKSCFWNLPDTTSAYLQDMSS